MQTYVKMWVVMEYLFGGHEEKKNAYASKKKYWVQNFIRDRT